MACVSDWVAEEKELGNFAYGGHFGVAKHMIKQHPKNVYQNFAASILLTDMHTYVAEKLYLILFGGVDFQD